MALCQRWVCDPSFWGTASPFLNRSRVCQGQIERCFFLLVKVENFTVLGSHAPAHLVHSIMSKPCFKYGRADFSQKLPVTVWFLSRHNSRITNRNTLLFFPVETPARCALVAFRVMFRVRYLNIPRLMARDLSKYLHVLLQPPVAWVWCPPPPGARATNHHKSS